MAMIHLSRARIHRRDLRTRMPFRYGIVTMTALPHVFLEVEASGLIPAGPESSRSAPSQTSGIAADHLPPKWFTKDAQRDANGEIDDMLAVIGQALDAASGVRANTLFAWWWDLFQIMDEWGERRGIEPLLTHFGTSFVERAMVDAFCRASGQPFHRLLRENAFGIDWALCEPSLADTDWVALLPEQPLDRATLRHTVGLLDPLTEADIPANERLDDGLPQSLDDCIRTYGLRHFKLKLAGRTGDDLDRLRHIAAVLEANAGDNFRFSLDANEQFVRPEDLRAFGERALADADLARFFEHLICIEQPLSRKVALASSQADVRACWPAPVPIIIDESDGGWADLPRALDLGYSGVSHKNCKGVFKGLRNTCLVRKRRAEAPGGRPWLTTAEDLCNIGPVALLQDLAVQAALGHETIERNGHHYFAGLSMFDTAIRESMLTHHPDLYQSDPQCGCRLRIDAGCIQLESVNRAPFGSAPAPATWTQPD